MGWLDVVLIMSAPRIGWLSASGMLACALLALAVVKFASGTWGALPMVMSGVVNLTALVLDFKRNG